ncbi:DUF1801 domain-containing protein [Thalassotalea sediminis]|uniref:DUF1801 domain-containing protein n=1 Tax=Thalassotalea sediminis TaxID=1759089 RepID=UPI002573887F|nr:DUF1801 domain-containing protein [Thalassotalea sediminis]
MHEDVKQKFDRYPSHVAKILIEVRSLIFSIAKDNGIEDLSETLKWGEPSYLCKTGTTIRYDWKEKDPHHFFIYFHCQTRLIDTFKEVYGDTFNYQGNRALVFALGDPIPINELSHCLLLALCYKKRRHLNLLGA